MKFTNKYLFPAAFCVFLSSSVLVSCKKDDAIVKKTTVLELIPSEASSVSGKATIEENTDHSFNIVLNILGTPKDSTIYIDVHNGNFQDPFGKQAINLGSIKCAGGPASNTVRNLSHITLPDLTRASITYDSILTYKAFINLSYVQAPHVVGTSIAHIDL